jgi:hypothetical protein
MDAQPDHPADEIERLRRCVDDLVRLLALPANWSDPSETIGTLLGMLHLDLVYVRLEDPLGESPLSWFGLLNRERR